jgi:hypothetical protein
MLVYFTLCYVRLSKSALVYYRFPGYNMIGDVPKYWESLWYF